MDDSNVESSFYSEHHHESGNGHGSKAPSNSFDAWVEGAFGRTATTNATLELELEFELAKQLATTDSAGSSSEEDSGISIMDTIHRLKEMQIRDNKEADRLVSWKGIRVGWFLHVLCESSFMRRVREFDCPLWFVRKVCIVQLILKSQGYSTSHNWTPAPGPLIDHVQAIQVNLGNAAAKDPNPDLPIVCEFPTTFISYTGRYKLEYFVQVLSLLDPKEYIWLDLVCINQFVWTGKSRSKEMQGFRESFMIDLGRNIQAIHRTVLLLEEWDHVMRTLGQIWVLWEIFNTAIAKAELQVLLPVHEVDRFISMCLKSDDGFGSVQKSLQGIDVNQARAEDDQDRRIILEHMRRQGFSKVNVLVLSRMRKWIICMGQEHLHKLRTSENKEELNPVFLNNMARLLHEHGMYIQAEPLYREALSRQQEMMGEHHPFTFVLMNNLVALLYTRGKLAEARLLMENALFGIRQQLGSLHPTTLALIHNSGMLQQALGHSSEARLLLNEALEGRQQQLGHGHPRTRASERALQQLNSGS